MIDKLENTMLPETTGARCVSEEANRSARVYSVPDDELENRVAHVLIWNALVPPNGIEVTASRGRITLTGDVEWDYQRVAAENAVRPMCGVVAVTNNIALRREPSARES